MFIFQSKHDNLWDEYKDFVRWTTSAKNITYGKHMKIYMRDVRWIVNGFFEEIFNIKRLGYSPNKITLLRKNYEDEDMLNEGRHILERQLAKKKDYISAAFPLITGRKMTRLKSYCMNSFVFIKDSAGCNIIITYRVTECIKKFGGDLAFLRELIPRYIPGELLSQVETVTFNFALLYAAPIYYPLIYTWGLRLPKKGHWFHERCQRELARADDLSIQPKYSQTMRVFKTYRGWKNALV